MKVRLITAAIFAFPGVASAASQIREAHAGSYACLCDEAGAACAKPENTIRLRLDRQADVLEIGSLKEIHSGAPARMERPALKSTVYSLASGASVGFGGDGKIYLNSSAGWDCKKKD